MDVLAKKWVGSLRFREADLNDKVLPSFPFRNEVFIARAYAIQDVEQRHLVVESSRSTSIDPMTVDIGVESLKEKEVEEEFVEDSKEGVLSSVNKSKAARQSMNDEDVGGLALVVRLCPQRLSGGSSRVFLVENEVIDIPDDDHVEKLVSEEVAVGLVQNVVVWKLLD
ncbi:unnamed protein product [Lactuca virosa]|uniref:Uncharacterized protein n=1 Tax=Lactuca virosa TaxID=75947 RepID=A0AAU9MI26_9ASTR|nr:unnamed protein product [Lactuca virosa]